MADTKKVPVKLANASKMIIFFGLAALAFLSAIDYWIDSLDIGYLTNPILLFIFAGVILTDAMKENAIKKKDPVRIFGMLVAAVAVVGGGLGLAGIAWTILNIPLGTVSALAGIFFVIEVFR